jgi:hemicentin
MSVLSNVDMQVTNLTDLIVQSQIKMRDFAQRQLKDSQSSRSCVSQRDIQRVFTFYQWFKDMYEKLKLHGEENHHRRALMVALGLVYYMRLNAEFRKEYSDYLDGVKHFAKKITFSKAFTEELDFYIDQVVLPKGIARTLALKENLFATIVCTATHTPLIIVGAPGSSKTLSFNLAIANLQGQESKGRFFREGHFHSLDPHHYQCSRRTTSKEIDKIFSHAIKRQHSHFKFNLNIYCVVFMDEAGLPEESHESLKVLHYYLDKREVSFVAITNHMLDAAKTNRAISLFRPEASNEDLETLAKGCLCSNPENPPAEIERDLETVVKFCKPYLDCMKDRRFSSFFGLRDFIHFINYLRRKRDEKNPLSYQLVMEALERNFNWFENFESICKKFLAVIGKHGISDQRHILAVLQDSMRDRPQAKQDLSENEVRYKLLIDPSEDDSLIRLLFSFDVLERQKTRILMCSDFSENVQIQKINTIAAIRHSAIQGHTVVMSQTDDIHESFYDLFNQRFRRIDDLKDGARYYTNIAIGSHSKPSRVHPEFQCIVVVKKSEVGNTPAPFLNRFEKYLISHASMLEAILKHLPASLVTLINAAKDKVSLPLIST